MGRVGIRWEELDKVGGVVAVARALWSKSALPILTLTLWADGMTQRITNNGMGGGFGDGELELGVVGRVDGGF